MSFEEFLEKMMPVLVSESCLFSYQRKNCKKHGHYKKRTNRNTKEIAYEIRIEKEDNDAAKIYTLSHEMTHMINRHLDNKELLLYQKEWVADDVGIKIIGILDKRDELLRSKLAQKWDVFSYGENYIKDKKISPQKQELMHVQSDYAFHLIVMHINKLR